ncbi:hypothetical protein [Natrinema halophilum]|uniref:Solute:sodium symporter small subunit n=1 Tax=Natrinema halophilum TaxID=1699371 RepID=A0A7D5KZJ2_9EURY|nr:hypothetical protein [Natrinema halophilum]QLG49360.1 hypothetical protein HYG82_11045 [Natrinema halophilum]
MSSSRTPQSALPVSTYVTDGATIAAILLVWGVIAAFFTYGIAEIGGPGSLFKTLGPQLGGVFVLTGLLNAILYLLYRTVEYWQQLTT